MTLRTVLLSLQALLAAAEPDDPQDAVVAQQYKEHPEIFRRTALHWTSVFAKGWLVCTEISSSKRDIIVSDYDYIGYIGLKHSSMPENEYTNVKDDLIKKNVLH